MNVFAESNFIIEIALAQGEAADANYILDSARRREIQLWVPSFSLCERFTTLARRTQQRKALANEIASQLNQLDRSATHRRERQRLRNVPQTLLEVSFAQAAGLDDTVAEILRIGHVIELTAEVFAEALRYRRRYGFSTTQDAVMYASVLSALKSQPVDLPKCFVTRNPRDFARDRGIAAELGSYNCRFMGTFAAAAAHVRTIHPSTS